MFKNARIVGVNVDASVYHNNADLVLRGDPKLCMSSSVLRAFWCCPSKWVAPIVAEDGSVSFWEFIGSKSTEWGDLFDCLILTPQMFDSKYAVSPASYEVTENVCPSCGSESKAKRCKACDTERMPKLATYSWNGQAGFCKKWKADREAEGKTCVSHKDHYNVKQAIARFRKFPELGEFVDESEHQVHVAADWHDEATGMIVPCQCLIDLVPRNDSQFYKSLADVKTTVNARVIPWEKWCHAAGYDIQAAWNTDMFIAATGREICSFCFLLSENTAPWQPGKRMMTNDLLDPAQDMGDVASGRRQYRKMMAAYCACLKSGNWPGYDDHDEAAGGWTIVSPNPYQEQARQFAPNFEFEDESPDAEPAPAEEADQGIVP